MGSMDQGPGIRIGLASCWHDDNKGDAAILLGTIQAIREFRHDCPISLFSLFSESDYRYANSFRFQKKAFSDIEIYPHKIGVSDRVSTERSIQLRHVGLGLKLIQSCINLSWPSLDRYLSAKLKDIDLLISRGGHHFVTHGNGGPIDLGQMFLFHSYPLLLARRLGKPFAILGQSVGPIKGRLAQRLVHQVFSQAAFIGVREELSKVELVKCGLPEKDVVVIPDLAFLIQPELSPRVQRILDQTGLQPKGFVVITPRQWFARHDSRYWKYVETIREVIRYLTGMGFPVLLLAHTLGPVSIEDDRVACKDVLGDWQGSKVFYIEEDLSPTELAALYGHARLLIGTRFHSVIFAFVGGTPAFAISYSGPKAPGIMRGMGLGSLTADMSSLTPSQVIEGVEQILQQEEDVRCRIQESVERNRREIRHAMEQMLTKTGLVEEVLL